MKARPALTFIELILYVGVSMFIILPIIFLTISMLDARVRAQREREVNENLRFVMTSLTQQIHDAESVNAVGNGSLILNLDSEIGGTITFDTSTKSVNGQTITYVREGGTQITSDLVDVSSISFTDLTRDTEIENIQISITVDSLDGTVSLTAQTTAALRE